MANPWFRLYAEFATDPKVQMLPEKMQRRLIMVLCARCCNVLETLHETELAFYMRVTEEELAETKQIFIDKKFIDENWNLLNWDKRQFASDSSTARVARHREKKKQEGNDDETLPKRKSNALDTDTDTDTDTDKKNKRVEQRAARLPADWVPDDELIEFCRTERPDLDPQAVADRFRDYWTAQAGAKGRKLDWPATWRNWVRNEKTQSKNPPKSNGKTAKFDPVSYVNKNRNNT